MSALLDDPYHYRPNDGLPWDRVQSIVLIQTKNLGDSLLLVPVIHALMAAAPHASIHLVIKSTSLPIFDGFARLSCHVVPKHLVGWLRLIVRLRRPDLFLNYQESRRHRFFAVVLRARNRSGLPVKTTLFQDTHPVRWRGSIVRHQCDRNLDVLRRLGLQIPQQGARLRLPRGQTPPNLPGLENTKYILVHPGSRWMFKTMRIDHWMDFIQQVVEQYQCQVIVTGGNSELETQLANYLGSLEHVRNLCGKTTIQELMRLVQHASAFIGVDTFAAHLAVAYERPGVVLFGPSDWRRWGPRTWDRLTAVTVDQEQFPCAPCNLDGCGGGKVSVCLENLNLREVARAFDQSINGIGHS